MNWKYLRVVWRNLNRNKLLSFINIVGLAGTKPDYSDVEVYWVRIDIVIDSLKHTNLSPYIKSLMQNQTAVSGKPFTFTVPDNIFFDDDRQSSINIFRTDGRW